MSTLRSASLAALLVISAAIAVPAAHGEEMNFYITNSHPNALEVELYSQDRDHVWPGDGQVYVFNDGEEKTIPISCDAGESICYGAWISGDQGTFWGVGPNSAENCSDCCYVCNGGATESIDLTE